jgi:hypothetical protein
VPEVNKSHSLAAGLVHFAIFAAGLGLLFALTAIGGHPSWHGGAAKLRVERRREGRVSPLAVAHSTCRERGWTGKRSEAPGNRTQNHRLKRPMLCQLS